MKYVSSFMLSFLFLTTANAYPVVSNLDLQRYQGTWNQIAAIPQFFAEDCASDTQANYTLLSNGEVRVINQCVRFDGTVDPAEGRARINPDYKLNSTLEVTFVKIFKKFRFFAAGDYWVTAIASDYSWVVVGHPQFEGLYILARNKTLPDHTLRFLKNKIEDIGYNSCDVLMEANSKNHFSGKERLCDLY